MDCVLPGKTEVPGRIYALVVATGIATAGAQLVFVRELLAQFQGNEIMVALVIFQWLVLGGCGALLAGLCRTFTLARMAALCLSLPVLALIQLAAMRWGRSLLAPAGMSVGFYQVFFFSLATLGPYCLAVGFMLPYSLLVMRYSSGRKADVNVYLADNLGDVCGAAIFSFWLVFWATPVQSIAIGHLGLGLLAISFSGPYRWILAGAVMVCLVAGLVYEPFSLRTATGSLEQVTESPYGRVALVRQGSQVTLVLDGQPFMSSHDRVRAEESVHYALSQAGTRPRVLVIAAVSGMMKELDKYDPVLVHLVELDPVVLAWQLKYGLIKNYAWLRPVRDDGRRWLKNYNRRYDVILVNLLEPDTYQANRFFTLEFFRAAADGLNEQGVLGFSIQAGGNYFSQLDKKIVASLYATAKMVFPHVKVFAGQRLYFICSRRPLDEDVPGLLEHKGVATAWVGPFFHGNVDLRSKELDSWLGNWPLLNSDLEPVVMRLALERWYSKFGGFPLGFYTCLAAVLMLLFIKANTVEKLIATTGFTAMGAEIWVILAFQIFHGNVYLKIGMIMTVFLAGLLPGAFAAGRCNRMGRWLAASDLTLALALALPAAGVVIFGSSCPEMVFFLAGFFISLLAGFQFPLALGLAGRSSEKAAGLFAIDVLAAAAGGLVTNLILIAYLGLIGAVAVLVALKVISYLMIKLSLTQ